MSFLFLIIFARITITIRLMQPRLLKLYFHLKEWWHWVLGSSAIRTIHFKVHISALSTKITFCKKFKKICGKSPQTIQIPANARTTEINRVIMLSANRGDNDISSFLYETPKQLVFMNIGLSDINSVLFICLKFLLLMQS